MYYGRFSLRATAKTVLAIAIVCTVGYIAGVYVTYPDLVTPCVAGTVAFYAAMSFIVRKMMK